MIRTSQPQDVARISSQWASSVIVATLPNINLYKNGSYDQLIKSSAHVNFIGKKGYEIGVSPSSYGGDADKFPDVSKVQSSGDSEQTTLVIFRRFSGSAPTPAIFSEVAGGVYSRNTFYFNGSSWAWRTRDSSTGDTGSAEDLIVKAPANGEYETRVFVYSVSANLKAAYLNGRLDASTSISVNAFTATAANGVFLNGIDSVNSNTNYGSDSRIALFVRFNRALSAAEVKSLSDNPWQIFAAMRKTIDYTSEVGGQINLTLNTASNSFAIESKTAALSLNRKIAVASGSYLVAGRPAEFLFNRKLSAVSGTYSIVGKTAALSYISGAITHNYTLSGDSSAYVLSTKESALVFARKIYASSFSHTISAKTAALIYLPGSGRRSYAISTAANAYAITSGSAGLNYGAIAEYASAPIGVTYCRDFQNSKRDAREPSVRQSFKNTKRY